MPKARIYARKLKNDGVALFSECKDDFSDTLNQYPTTGRVLVIGVASVEIAGLQAPQIIAARLAANEVYVLLPTPAPALEKIYRKFGVSKFVYMTNSLGRNIHFETDRLMKTVTTGESLQTLEYKGLSVGKFTLSTLMRQTRRGKINADDPASVVMMRERLSNSLHHTDGAISLMTQIKPNCVYFIDRGYTPEGEYFEAALQFGAKATTLNTAHRSGLMCLKRYNTKNKSRHFATLSDKSWRQALDMTFTDIHWQELYKELKDTYESGEWYDEVGTQFGKKIIAGDSIISDLCLDPSKKTGVLFAHMFWDATFFWGVDIFEDYEDWFIQSLKAMAKNKDMNWIVKLHPANNVKDKRDNYNGDHVEYDAINKAVGDLPAHIKVLAPDAPISTFSLFNTIDYCLTVRGTIGIECASFGIPVITAGTGRYDGLGFTRDNKTPEEYLSVLETLHEFPPMEEGEIELARRFAWVLLFKRTLKYETVHFHYKQDAQATLKIKVNPKAVDDTESMLDLQVLSHWLSGDDEDLVTINK